MNFRVGKAFIKYEYTNKNMMGPFEYHTFKVSGLMILAAAKLAVGLCLRLIAKTS